MTVLVDNAAAPGVLEAAGIGNAARLIVAIPNVYEAGQIVARARAANAGLSIIARAHSDADVEHLEQLGASHVVWVSARPRAGWSSSPVSVQTEATG